MFGLYRGEERQPEDMIDVFGLWERKEVGSTDWVVCYCNPENGEWWVRTVVGFRRGEPRWDYVQTDAPPILWFAAP